MERIPSRLDSPPFMEVLNRFDSKAAAQVSGAAETVDYFG